MRRRCAIKWPNDLLADGAKLSGILLERQGDAVIVGFGVNLAASPGRHRPARDQPAPHLQGPRPTPAAFLEILAAAFARWLVRWRGAGLERRPPPWLAAAHPPGTPLSTSRRAEGLFDGLDESGALRLRLADGTCASSTPATCS